MNAVGEDTEYRIGFAFVEGKRVGKLALSNQPNHEVGIVICWHVVKVPASFEDNGHGDERAQDNGNHHPSAGDKNVYHGCLSLLSISIMGMLKKAASLR